MGGDGSGVIPVHDIQVHLLLCSLVHNRPRLVSVHGLEAGDPWSILLHCHGHWWHRIVKYSGCFWFSSYWTDRQHLTQLVTFSSKHFLPLVSIRCSWLSFYLQAAPSQSLFVIKYQFINLYTMEAPECCPQILVIVHLHSQQNYGGSTFKIFPQTTAQDSPNSPGPRSFSPHRHHVTADHRNDLWISHLATLSPPTVSSPPSGPSSQCYPFKAWVRSCHSLLQMSVKLVPPLLFRIKFKMSTWFPLLLISRPDRTIALSCSGAPAVTLGFLLPRE